MITLLLLSGETPDAAQCLRENIRKTDLVGRVNDRLAVVLTESARPEGDKGFSERVNEMCLAALRLAARARAQAPGLRAGACLMPEDKTAKVLLDTLILGAEAALTAAVAEGQPVIYKGLQRFLDVARPQEPFALIRIGELHIDREHKKILFGAQSIEFLRKEMDILLYLLKNAGKTVRRDEMLRAVWGEDAAGAGRAIDMHIVHLRRKLAVSPSIRIYTVKGEGYRLERQD